MYSKISKLGYENPEKFQTQLKKTFWERFKFVKNLEWNDGFAGYLIQDENNTKIFVFRGSEFTKPDIQDIAEDAKIGLWFVPWDQIEAMIEKIDPEITKDEKVIFVWHSLGGALTQIATSMYLKNVIHSYAFNAPGTQNLDVIESGIGDRYKEKFNTYKQEKQNPALNPKLTNYDAQEWVAQMGIDIGEIFPIDNMNHAIDAWNETLEREYTPSVDSKLWRWQYAQMEKVLQVLKYENMKQ